MDFNGFIDKMSSDTGSKMTIPSGKKIKEEHEKKEPVPQKPQPPAQPKPKAKAKEIREELPSEEGEVLDEETVEKILDVTSIIMKTVRQAFPEKKIRRMAYESIQNAISLSLGESKTAPGHIAPTTPQIVIPPKAPGKKPGPAQEKWISSETWDKIPSVTEGVDPFASLGAPIQMRMNPGLVEQAADYQDLYGGQEYVPTANTFNRSFSIKPGQGLVGASTQDIYDLQVLAGIRELPK